MCRMKSPKTKKQDEPNVDILVFYEQFFKTDMTISIYHLVSTLITLFLSSNQGCEEL